MTTNTIRPIFYTAILQVFSVTLVTRKRFPLGTTNILSSCREIVIFIARLADGSPSPERLLLLG
jgi:hypothetical protein